MKEEPRKGHHEKKFFARKGIDSDMIAHLNLVTHVCILERSNLARAIKSIEDCRKPVDMNKLASERPQMQYQSDNMAA